MSFVVDASVVIKWYLEESLWSEARHLVERADELHAPDLLIAELGNVAWKRCLREDIDARQAGSIVHSVANLPIRLHPSRGLAMEALRIALRLRHPLYDALYLACAERLGSFVVTADDRLLRTLKNTELADLAVHLTELAGRP